MMSTLKITPASPYRVSYPALLAGSGLLGVGLWIVCGFYHERQEIMSERAILKAVYSRVALPEETPPHRLYTALSQYASEHEEARRARIARMAGIEPDWAHILERVSKLNVARRSQIYQAMATEYGLPDTWTPADVEQRALLEQSRPGLHIVPQEAGRPAAD